MDHHPAPLAGFLALLIVSAGACDAKQAPTPESDREETRQASRKTDEPASKPDREPLAGVPDGLRSDVRQHFVDMSQAGFEDTQQRLDHLTEMAQFLADEPSADALDSARRAWLDAHRAWISTEVYLYADHPARSKGLADRIDTWPIRPSHVDYIPGEPEAGLINQSDTELDEDTLLEFHQKGGEDYATTGFHVVELLLWGWSGGNTEERRYASAFGGDRQTAPNPDRRRQYLQAAVELLADQHEQLLEMWSPESEEDSRSDFLERTDAEAIGEMLASMRRVCVEQLAGKRLRGPLEDDDLLALPSPFSRTGLTDIRASLGSLRHFYIGVDARSDNSRLEGPGLQKVVAAAAPELDKRLRDQLDGAIELVEEIPQPYDEALKSDAGRPKIREAADQLETIGETLDQIAEKLGTPI